MLEQKHEKCIGREKSQQSHLEENKRIKAELRRRSNTEFLKIDKIFQNFDNGFDL